MTASQSSPAGPRTGTRLLRSTAIFLFLALLAGIFIFRGLGHWLVVEDPLEKAQAIAILSGRMPVRAEQAARLYREGYAAEIWLTHSTEPGATLAEFGVAYTGEEIYNQQVLLHQGVPGAAIRVLEPPIVNTADEMNAIAAALDAKPSRVVIIVTTKAHTRRARTLWHKLAAPRGRAIVRAAQDDPFDPAHWWRNTSDALEVVREVLGLFNAWAGLPLRPSH
jgi:uncharacterized SAM-binding protein YcdF (DUF218 family)